VSRALQVLAAIGRLGVAEAAAYRAALLVWVLTTTFPLVSLALWSTLAVDGPIGDFDQRGFVTYFVGAFLVRQMTSAWVVWELDYTIRDGSLSTLLMRPVHPIVHHAMMNLSALPVRLVLAVPLGVAVLVATGGLDLASDARTLALVPVAIALAWMINFLGQVTFGCLAFWLTRAAPLYEIWIGLYIVLSGYAVPTSLFPWGLDQIARALPFHSALGFVVELLAGRLAPDQIAAGFAVQLLWIGVFGATASLAWRRGIRAYGAVGA
jgi:ABC-2 type transport system permease protein